MMWNGDGWWIVMWVWMALFWLGVIVGAVWLMKSFQSAPGDGDDAHEILDRRLAGGDIDVDEHRRLSAALGGSRRAGSRGPTVGLLIALVLVVGFVTMSIGAVLASDWDGWGMWNMHGRGRNTSDSSVFQGGSQANIRIEDFAFEPGNLVVSVGATVTWANEDSATHDAKARNGDWQTERLSKGETDTIIFDRAGDYDYFCSIHPSMKAKLVVR